MIYYFIIATVVGFLLSFLAGIALALIFIIIWIDKSVIGYFEVFHRIGIELTTVATIFLGFLYGPIPAFVFTMVVILLAHGFKLISFPGAQSEWPPFVPHPYNLIDAIGAAAAAMLSGLPLFNVLIIVLIAKTALYMIFENLAFGKPPNFVGAFINIVFNIAVFVPMAQLFISLTGVNLAL